MYYEIIKPPKAYANPLEATRDEAETYWHWFLDNKTNRLKILESYIRSFEKYKDWRGDFSQGSLEVLEKWLESEPVEIRKLDEEEIKKIRASYDQKYKNMGISDWTLSNKSISLGFDVGLYLAETFSHHYPNLNWMLFQKRAKYIDNNQPVLKGFGNDCFNPDRIGQVIMRKVASGNRSDLLKLYNVWRSYLD